MCALAFQDLYPARPCPICDSHGPRHLHTQHFYQIDGGGPLRGYDVVVCRSCGFSFADHIPPQRAFDDYYRDLSKYENVDKGGDVSPQDEKRYGSVVALVAGFLNDNNAQILDVGCSTGKLLDLFRGHGFGQVRGLDPSAACVQTAEIRYGIEVHQGTMSALPESLCSAGPFDCIILSGILEHFSDLDQALAKTSGLLDERGIIFVEVPDATAFAAHFGAPFQEFSTEHLNFFSPLSLRNIMARYGFSEASSQRAVREHGQSSVMPSVAAVFTRGARSGRGEFLRDEETEPRLRDYIQRSKEVDREVEEVIRRLVKDGTEFVVWGTGTHTQRLLATGGLAEARILAFVDSNPRYQGKTLAGRPILPPGELSHFGVPILVSTRVFQAEIEDAIRNKLKLGNAVIKLY